MRELRNKIILAVMVSLCLAGSTVQAKDSSADQPAASGQEAVIENGIYVEDMNLSGMNAAEAEKTVEDYIQSLKEKAIVLKVNEENQVQTTAGELGLTWSNPEIIEEAASYGIKGNIIQRYKAKKDLEHENKVFTITYDVTPAVAKPFLEENCAAYEIPAVNASLKREDGAFTVVSGKEGLGVEIDQSLEAIRQYLNGEWKQNTKGEAVISLVTQVEEPKGSAEELSKVRDVLGTFTTDYHTSGGDRSANVANGCSLINGTTLYPGDSFSTYEAVSPFSRENGYHMAGSYLNGMVVESLGGGICQVSTTLYNAVLRAELQVDERFNHSMIVSYVDPSADAAIAGTSKDFKFTNSSEYPVYIEGITDNKKITFTVYGVETRDPDREVTYESEVLKRTVPEQEKIIADAGRPVGSINVQSAHVGYVARLWKVVTENGKEVSRTQVNDSSYRVTPKTATVGIAHADPAVTAAMQAAIASGSIDYVKGVIANYKAATAPPTDPAVLAAQQALAQQQALEQQQAQQAQQEQQQTEQTQGTEAEQPAQ
ncbi:MAG: VanW family protein [Lachnospiraceae bacterium]|nr:VanW family protein [Lachnospiraceae bacterium]